MAIFTFAWCRTEGTPIPDLEKEYGKFNNLPLTTRVFFGTPEIQIYNPFSSVNGCVYKVVPLSSFGGYTKITDIDEHYTDILQEISDYDKAVEMDKGSQYYTEPFVVTESCVIFHADSTSDTFTQNAIILVDQYSTPNIVTVTANYFGDPVPVGDKFNTDYILVYAIYSNGYEAIIKEGCTIEPKDKVITNVGSNIVMITYTAPDGTKFVAKTVIEGIKKLIGIEVVYDGPSVSYGNEALRKYFVVVAKYSDNSTVTITDFSFPSGNIVSESNNGVITVYYKGFYYQVEVPTYTVTSSRLIALYNGPNVEVGNNIDTSYAKLRIYYNASNDINSYFEDLDPSLCSFSPLTIDHEGINQILVQYVGKAGPVSTYMIVAGIRPEVKLNFIDAKYTGPEIMQGKTFSLERVIVKAHYSDGTVTQVKNFTVNSNVVNFAGLNEFEVIYRENGVVVTTVLGVKGIPKDSTTQSNYSPIYLQNNYPEATRLNHRFRGPAENRKQRDINTMLFQNITTLYELFANIEEYFNEVSDTINANNAIRYRTLNCVGMLKDGTDKWMHDKRFVTGKYKQEESDHE